MNKKYIIPHLEYEVVYLVKGKRKTRFLKGRTILNFPRRYKIVFIEACK